MALVRVSITGATEQIVQAAGGQSITSMKKMNIIFAHMEPAQADALAAKGYGVKAVGGITAHVGPPVPVPIGAAVNEPEDLSATLGFNEFRAMVTPALFGKFFNVAILDTGIMKTHEKLNTIQQNVIYEKDYTGSPSATDVFDHGTGVAGVVCAVAPQCGILNMKVVNDVGVGTEEEIVLALDDIIDMYDRQDSLTPCVINMSLGGADDGDPDNIMRIACREAASRGIWLTAAAGNTGPNASSIMMPGVEPVVCAVGSMELGTLAVSSYSSRGPSSEGVIKPDVMMFGSNINLASAVGNSSYVVKSGTSFACPFVSGLMLLTFEGIVRKATARGYLANMIKGDLTLPKMDYVIDSLLPATCIKPEGAQAGKDNEYGYGLVYGPLVKDQFTQQAVSTTAVVEGFMPIMMIGMLAGMV